MADKLAEIAAHIKNRKEHLLPLLEVTLKMRNNAIRDKDEIAQQICNADKRNFEAHFFELNEIEKILNQV